MLPVAVYPESAGDHAADMSLTTFAIAAATGAGRSAHPSANRSFAANKSACVVFATWLDPAVVPKLVKHVPRCCRIPAE